MKKTLEQRAPGDIEVTGRVESPRVFVFVFIEQYVEAKAFQISISLSGFDIYTDTSCVAGSMKLLRAGANRDRRKEK
jgi:hypothetical protein